MTDFTGWSRGGLEKLANELGANNLELKSDVASWREAYRKLVLELEIYRDKLEAISKGSARQ